MSLIAYTRTQLVTQVRAQIQERTASMVTDAEIQRWLDIALLDVAASTHCLRATASAACSASQQMYTLSATCLGPWALTRVEYAGRKLECKSFDTIDEVLGGSNLSSQGDPMHYFAYGRQIGLWPVPAVNSAVLKYWYARHSESLSADAMSITTLGFSLAHGPAIESYATARGLQFKGKLQEAQGALQAYQRDLSRADGKVMPDNVPDELRSSG